MLKFGDNSFRAKKWVNSQGFSLSPEPDYEIPDLPADITAIHEENLMQLFTEITSWLDYVEVAYVAAQVDLRADETDLETIQAQEIIRHKITEKNVSTAKAMAYLNKDFLLKKDTVNEQYGRMKMLESVYNSLERKRFIISREISRRRNRDL